MPSVITTKGCVFTSEGAADAEEVKGMEVGRPLIAASSALSLAASVMGM